jgi:glycosyltransferase involved in cell wall biosynthesis
MSEKYILITVAKNEENNLPALIESIIGQSLKPVLYVIVDDGSEDRTLEIIENVENMHKFIIHIPLKSSRRDISFHYANICKIGMEYAIEYCNKMNITWEYIGLIDADIVLPNNYFKYLMYNFENDIKLGIASGNTWSKIGNNYVEEKQRGDLPSGAARLWRKQCFEDTGGYHITHASDSVSTAKAKIRGWNTRRFKELVVFHNRMVGAHEGSYKRFKERGKADFFLNTPFWVVILKFFKILLKDEIKLAISYLSGYIDYFVKNAKKIDDAEVKYYFKYVRPKELKKYYSDKIKEKFDVIKKS